MLDPETIKELPSTLVDNFNTVRKIWTQAELPDPYVYADFDEDANAHYIDASWMRYDIVVHICTSTWFVMDLSRSYIYRENDISWCEPLKYRIDSDPIKGKSVTDMSDRIRTLNTHTI